MSNVNRALHFTTEKIVADSRVGPDSLKEDGAHALSLCDQLKFSKQSPQRALLRPQTDRSVTFATERANQNSCPFYCHKIVISLVKGMMQT
jgi:hypothetical protein